MIPRLYVPTGVSLKVAGPCSISSAVNSARLHARMPESQVLTGVREYLPRNSAGHVRIASSPKCQSQCHSESKR